MTNPELAALLRQLAEKATPGEWRWQVNECGKSVSLGSMRHIAIDFVRYGMAGAAPRFPVDGIMTRADKLAKPVPGMEHHAEWNKDLDHPNAALIVALKNNIPALLEALDYRSQADGE